MTYVICFHNPDENNGYLSNWYLSDFILNGTKFSSVEQYMMYNKAIRFNDIDIANKILKTNDVSLIKALGRSVSNYDDSIWNAIREKVVFDGVLAKFSQNDKLKHLLINTGDSILAEAAVKDLIWGIGLSMKDENRLDPNKWHGKNLLGKVLMQVRDELK